MGETEETGYLFLDGCRLCNLLLPYFKPKSNNTLVEEAGFNASIPQAKDGQLQSDKQKAYEQQLLEQK